MDSAFLDWRFRADLWVACAAMAVFAAFVTLNLVRGMSSAHASTARRSLIGAASALAGGVWASHFIVMAGDPLPFPLGYAGEMVAGALLLAVACSAVALWLGIGLGAGARPGLRQWTLGALAFGAGAIAAPVLAISAIHLDPQV